MVIQSKFLNRNPETGQVRSSPRFGWTSHPSARRSCTADLGGADILAASVTGSRINLRGPKDHTSIRMFLLSIALARYIIVWYSITWYSVVIV